MLICDLAETYNIYDYRSHSPRLIATLFAGLRDNSRLVQEMCDVKASQQNLLLAHIADKLSLLIKCFAGEKVSFESMVDIVSGADHNSKSTTMAFDSNDDFKAYWDMMNDRG